MQKLRAHSIVQLPGWFHQVCLVSPVSERTFLTMRQGREKKKNGDRERGCGEGNFFSYLAVSHRYPADRGVARSSRLRREVRSALIIVNQTSGRRTVPAKQAQSCASTIIVEIGENIDEEGAERCLANARGNREISADRVYVLQSRDPAR